MRHAPLHGCQFFFTTTPMPCPYLDGKTERRVVTELIGRGAPALHDRLSLAGFRRSHGIAYAPACPDCRECIPVRIVVSDFQLSRSQRRVLAHNRDIDGRERRPEATAEQFALFARYLDSRHADGDMASMDHADYRSLIEDTPVESAVIEYRDGDGTLLAGCLTDRLGDGLSAVYSFFDPTQPNRGLGTYMVLWLIDRARALSLPYVYLGYWIKGSRKMAYKTRYRPLEALIDGRWAPVSGE